MPRIPGGSLYPAGVVNSINNLVLGQCLCAKGWLQLKLVENIAPPHANFN